MYPKKAVSLCENAIFNENKKETVTEKKLEEPTLSLKAK